MYASSQYINVIGLSQKLLFNKYYNNKIKKGKWAGSAARKGEDCRKFFV